MPWLIIGIGAIVQTSCDSFFEGYISALRHADALEPYLISRLEEEAMRFFARPV